MNQDDDPKRDSRLSSLASALRRRRDDRLEISGYHIGNLRAERPIVVLRGATLAGDVLAPEVIVSGLIYGYASMVDGMIRRLKEELSGDPTVVATGGFAPLIAEVANSIDAVDLDLTLEGLRIISAELETPDA